MTRPQSLPRAGTTLHGTSQSRANDGRGAQFSRRFAVALRDGDAKLAERIAEDAIASGFSPSSVLCHVVAPAMERIGDLWACGEATVADEHLATAISHDVLARLFPRLLTATARSRERIMLAAAAGEDHVLGLRMVADMLEGAGFDVLYLGSDVPLEAVLEACKKHHPAVLCLTATMASCIATLLVELMEVSRLPQPPLLMLGGSALLPLATAGLHVPVVACGDQAVATVESLLAGGRQGAPVEQALLERVLQETSPDVDTIASRRGSHSMLDRFGAAATATALASADTARTAARHAFAMEQLAFRDPLTGTWNRRAFDDHLAGLAEDAENVKLLMIDIDHFKSVNDTCGHETGDATLVAVAQSIAQHVRLGDFVARYGGDEFIVLLAGATLAKAEEVAERIRLGVLSSVLHPPVTVSVGAASFSGDHRLAGISVDRALYRAKMSGRNRVASEELTNSASLTLSP